MPAVPLLNLQPSQGNTSRRSVWRCLRECRHILLPSNSCVAVAPVAEVSISQPFPLGHLQGQRTTSATPAPHRTAGLRVWPLSWFATSATQPQRRSRLTIPVGTSLLRGESH